MAPTKKASNKKPAQKLEGEGGRKKYETLLVVATRFRVPYKVWSNWAEVRVAHKDVVTFGGLSISVQFWTPKSKPRALTGEERDVLKRFANGELFGIPNPAEYDKFLERNGYRCVVPFITARSPH